MKILKLNFYFVIAASLLILQSSCSEIKKETAKELLIGTYSGKAIFIYKHSLQNVGLEDETAETEGTVSIFRDSNDEIVLKTGDGNLKLEGITFATNGTTFNIPYQKVKPPQGKIQEISGVQVAEFEGNKYDGIYFLENEVINFGYETAIEYDYWGTKANVSVICVYEFEKMN